MGADLFGLSERARLLHGAGLRYVLKEPEAPSEMPAEAEEPAPVPQNVIPSDAQYTAQYLTKLQPGCRTVWTYYELGLDLGGRPDDDRRALFKRIIESVKWPAKSIAFWPLAFLEGEELTPDVEFFLLGVEEIGAGTIFSFGKKSFEVLFPDKPFQIGQYPWRNKSVVTLPGPTAMLSGSGDAKRIVWHALKNFPISSCR